MRHVIPCMVLLLLLGGCGGAGSGQAGGGGGASTAWLVVIAGPDGAESITHQFLRWDGGGAACSAARRSYEGYVEAWGKYWAASTALFEKWGDDPNVEQNPEYRRQRCELDRIYSTLWGGTYAGGAYSDFGDDADLLWLTLNHPDSDEGEPVAGSYTLPDDSSYGDDDDSASTTTTPSFSGYRSVGGNPYQAYLDAMDCDAYAQDLEADLFPEIDEEDLGYQIFSLAGGTLDLSEKSSTEWRLALSGGRQEDEEGNETSLELDASFARCEIRYDLWAVE